MTQRPPTKSQTVAERIRLASTRLTPSEHKLANALLASYPVVGLSSITEFAKAANWRVLWLQQSHSDSSVPLGT